MGGPFDLLAHLGVRGLMLSLNSERDTGCNLIDSGKPPVKQSLCEELVVGTRSYVGKIITEPFSNF